jgi:hypothetical protein
MKSITLFSLCFFQTKSHPINLKKSQLLSPVYILLLVLGMSSSSFGQLFQNTTTQVVLPNGTVEPGSTSQTYTWTACANDSLIVVECWGAGGGGARSQTNHRCAAGGGGGAYVRDTITVTPGVTYTVTVGGGGEGWMRGDVPALGAGTIDQAQRPGRPSFFANLGGDTLVLAAGGQSPRTSNEHDGNSSGGAVVDCIFSPIGIAYAGGRGAAATQGILTGGSAGTGGISGAGGGGAGSTDPGGSATAGVSAGGIGASVGGGNGAAGVTSGGNHGNPGLAWGGGGSGAYKGGGGSADGVGGFGAHGAVRITRFNDTLSLSDGSCLPTPLPIELLSFEGALNNSRAIDLNWSTASEINNDYFTIKRSYDGLNWQVVSHVNGAGNSQSLLNYSIADNSFDVSFPTVYYSLQQTDFDGTVSPDTKIAVNISELWGDLLVYPNPTNGALHVKIMKEGGNEQLLLVDLLGKEHTNNVTVESFGQGNEFLLNVSQLSSGVYYVVYGSERIKFVKTDKGN